MSDSIPVFQGFYYKIKRRLSRRAALFIIGLDYIVIGFSDKSRYKTVRRFTVQT